MRIYLLIVVTTLVGAGVGHPAGGGGLPSLAFDGDIYSWEAIIAALIAGGAAVAVTSRSRLGAVTALGVVGYGIALVYLLFSAPDLALAQILVETLTVLLFVLVFYHMPKFGADTKRGSRMRDGAIAIAGGVLVTVFVLAAAGTTPDSVGRYFLEASQPLAKGQNVVNTIIVDFRALDTLAEVAVLAIAGFGVYALLKLRAGPPAARGRSRMRGLILPTATTYLMPVLLVFSVFLLLRGHNEPGGGFAGGLVAASAFVLLSIADDVDAARRALRVDPRSPVGIGLLIMLRVGFVAPLLGGEPYLTSLWWKFDGRQLHRLGAGRRSCSTSASTSGWPARSCSSPSRSRRRAHDRRSSPSWPELLFAAAIYLMLRRSVLKLALGLSLLANAANLVIFVSAG